MFNRKIGIDLGTTNTLVFIPKKGIVINEPSVVAVALIDNEILAVGKDAKDMLGRTPEGIKAVKPLREGVIADYKITSAMINYFIKRASRWMNFVRPEIMISVPAGITSTERRAVIEAAMKAGAKAAYIVKEPVLAAIGANISINEPVGNMIINMGGGTTEIAVISLGGIVSWASVRVAGNKLDQAIAEYIKRKYNLAIGETTAENIKLEIGTAIALPQEEIAEIRGRDLITGLPKVIEISSNEIPEAINGELRDILRAVKEVFQNTPPELAADIMNRGITLSGGGALLRNIDKFYSQHTGVSCVIAQEPLFCVAKGAGAALDNLDVYKKSIMTKKA
jgi:rod shape-determining protein MreB